MLICCGLRKTAAYTVNLQLIAAGNGKTAAYANLFAAGISETAAFDIFFCLFFFFCYLMPRLNKTTENDTRRHVFFH